MSTFYLLQLLLLICIQQRTIFGMPVSTNPGSNRMTSYSSLDGRIVGGTEAPIHFFPHQVSLRRNGRHICGAIIIHAQVVLTAAHCVDGQNAETMSVHAGSADLYQGGTLTKVRSLIPHEAYNFPTLLNNDIALVILKEPLTFSRSIQRIPLMSRDNDPELDPKAILFVSGWGATTETMAQSTTRLRYTAVQEIDHAKCSTAYKSFTTVTPTMLCAGIEQGGRDSCQGDSGGPLITAINASYKLVGIVSWGIGCARSGYPGVYTRVSMYENWIRQHIMQAGNFELN